MSRSRIRVAFEADNTFVLQMDLRLARLCVIAMLLALAAAGVGALILPAQAAPNAQGPTSPTIEIAVSGAGSADSTSDERPANTPPCAGSPQSYSLPVGSGLAYTYSINPGSGTPSSALSFSVSATFNPAFLHVVKIDKGNFPGITNFQSSYNNTTGVYQASGSISPPSPPSPPNNTTVVVTFATVAATPSTPLDSTLVTTDTSGTYSCEAILNLTITAPTPTATPSCTQTASISTLSTDRTCYPPGSQMGVFVGVGTTLSSQSVLVRALLLSGDIGVASAERTFTAPNGQVIPLSVPMSLAAGDYTILVDVYDASGSCPQATQTTQVHINPACGTVTPVLSATPTRTPTYTPSATPTPTRTPTRTATPTPAATTACIPPRPEVTPSCAGSNYVRNPGFEAFNRSWGELNTTGQEIVSSVNAYSGFYSAYFDGPAGLASHQLLYQFMDIPSDATNASFWAEEKGYGAATSLGAPPPSGLDYFRASLYDATLSTELVRLWQFNPLIPPDCHQDPDGYNLSPADLDLVRGRTVALVFEFQKVTTTGWSAFVELDDIHFDVCAPSPPCGVGDDKTASPSVVQPGGDVAVTLSLTGLGSTCGNSHPPADVMLVIDRSGSMDGQKIADARAAAKGFVDRMDLTTGQVGLVSFSDTASLDQVLTQNAGPVRTAIDALVADGSTNIADAITLAQGELVGPRHRPANQRVLILMSDGQPTAGGDPRAAATAAKAAGTRIFTIGLGGDVDPNLMRDLASSPADYYFAPDSSRLDAIYQQIAGAIGGAAATNITVIDRLSPNVTLVPNSFFGLPAPDISPDGRTLTWRIPRLGLETLRWGYHVTMTQTPGTWPTNTSATATYTNSNGQSSALTFPIPNVTVLPGQTGHPQLLCRDYERDTGFVPSNLNREAWWESPDIWVRNQPDGIPAQQNPIAGQTNYVYVRVHNTGDVTVNNIMVHLYNTAASAGPRWPDDWTPEIGERSIPNLAPGEDAVVSIPWTPLAQGHYCFLARIEASTSPIINDGWVPFDRQVCQKNVQIIGGGSSTTTIDVANPNRDPNYGAVSVSSTSIPTGSTSVVSMPPDLFQRWQGAGGTVTGGHVVPGTSSIQLDVTPQAGTGAGTAQAVINRIPLQGDETQPLTFKVTGAAGSPAPVLDVRQVMNGQVVGGNLISPPLSSNRIFLPLLARGLD
ncbi:MAG: vWA domain-containing protein [Anaerolineae bacterium]